MKKLGIFLFSLTVTLFLSPVLSVATDANNGVKLPYTSNDILDNIGVRDPSAAPILTRYWTDGWTKFGNPPPAVAYFNGNNGYHGYLSKYKEMPQYYGKQGTYQGYFYHYSLPLPIPSYSPLTYLNSFLFEE